MAKPLSLKMSNDYFKPICELLGTHPDNIQKLVITLEADSIIVVEETRYLEEDEE